MPLRRAFTATTKDGEFVAELKKARLDVDPVAGDELERSIAGAFKTEPAVLGKRKQIFSQ